MPDCFPARVGAFAIVPSNNLPAAIPFWQRLGFTRTGGGTGYIIMTGWGCEVHPTKAGTGPWSVPAEHNLRGIHPDTGGGCDCCSGGGPHHPPRRRSTPP